MLIDTAGFFHLIFCFFSFGTIVKLMCHESSSRSSVVDCRDWLSNWLSTSFKEIFSSSVRICVFISHYYLPVFHLRILEVSCHGRLILLCLYACVCASLSALALGSEFKGRLCCMHGCLSVFLSARVTSGSWWWAGTGGRCPSESVRSWGWSIPRLSVLRGWSPRDMTSGSPGPAGSK